jgi:tripeptide aminopeptidase
MIDSDDLLERFLSYVQVDTRSDPHSPSTPSQWVLVRKLEAELRELGVEDVRVTEYGYVLATVPPTTRRKGVPRLALLAHLDTASGCSGACRPIVHRNYQGQPIALPAGGGIVLNVENTPALAGKKGEDIITSSGDSLLGADDKAGVAIVVSLVRHLLRHPEITHGPLRICFNPDEEIGRGSEKITLEELGADAAYTLDAHDVGVVDYESFSADKAVLTIHGVASHPGWAKGVMVNAMRLAASFIQGLPMTASPEETSGRQGFVHPHEMQGTPEKIRLEMLLRDFELDGLAGKRKIIEELIARLQAAEPRARFELEVTPQYRNMRYWLEKDFRPVEYAIEAVRRLGLTPVSEPIRGGTDGSRLTERGLPTPNIFTGFHNVHSEREWVSLQDMVKAVEALIQLVRIWEERAGTGS